MTRNVSHKGTGKFRPGVRLTSKLNHIKPTNCMFVAAIDSLEDSVVRAESGFGRDVAHAEQHLKDIGKAVGLVEVVRGALVKRPLEVISKRCSTTGRSVITYALRKVFIVPRTEQPASALHAVQKDNCNNVSIKPATLLALEKSAFQIVDDKLAQLRGTLLHGST